MADQSNEPDHIRSEEFDEYQNDNIMIGTRIDTEFKDKVNSKLLMDVIQRTLDSELESGVPVEMGLVIGPDTTLRELNRQFRGVDAPTDVLSFAMLEGDVLTDMPPGMPMYLGDVIVSYPRAREQARAAGHSIEEELNLLIVHGVLHLLGYDHDTEDRRKRMWARQETILGKRLID